MTTVAVRGISLEVKAPTLDDIIRGVIQPVQSTGDTVTFKIPDWVQVGDFLLVYSYNRTYGSFINSVAGWTNWQDQSDYAEDITGWFGTELQGSTYHQYYHVVVSGDAGDDVTFTYECSHGDGLGSHPITFGNPIVCGLVFKGDFDSEDGNIGGVGFDYNYDDASATYTKPYQLLVYFNGLYGGGTITPPPGASVLSQFSNDSSVLISAKVVLGSGSANYHIVPGNIGIWAIDSIYPVAFA